MLGHDAAEDVRASEWTDPVDLLEPDEELEEYREAATRMLVFMRSAFAFIHEARSTKEFNIRFWAVCSAIEHPACGGRSDLEIARIECDTTRANFCKHKLAFERENNLPPTSSQKSIKARLAYSNARKEQLHGN